MKDISKLIARRPVFAKERSKKKFSSVPLQTGLKSPGLAVSDIEVVKLFWFG